MSYRAGIFAPVLRGRYVVAMFAILKSVSNRIGE